MDGLCGIYSVVNALRHLLQLNKEQSQELFERLVKALVQDSRRPHKLLVEGILFKRLKQLAAAARRCRLADRDLSFQVRTLRLRRDEQTLAKLWATLDQEVGPACVAIIGITGADDHWCVVYRVTPKTLRLLDSSGRSCIRRSRCTVRTARTRYCLELSEHLELELEPEQVVRVRPRRLMGGSPFRLPWVGANCRRGSTAGAGARSVEVA